MHFVSATTTDRDPDAATLSLVTQTLERLDGRSPDLALLFLSPHFRQHSPQISDGLRAALDPRVLVGCTGEGVIGRQHEIEGQPALSLITGHLPDVALRPFALRGIDWKRLLSDEETFKKAVGAGDDAGLIVLLADPFSTPMDDLLTAFNRFYDGLPVIGGMASGGSAPGTNALLLDEQIATDGAVGLVVGGDVAVDVIVSQGCRPVGRPFVVTAAHRNVLVSLDGQPPLTQLQHMMTDLSDADRELLRTKGLHVGRAVGPQRGALGRGDFLIRAVMDIDQHTGVMAVGDFISPGELIQFHVRDADTAEEDLELMLATQELLEPPRGAFLFSCNGRGTRLYDHPDGDIATIQSALGGVDLAGFFCAGEIGPVGGRNFLHGQTASMVLFRTPEEALQLRE